MINWSGERGREGKGSRNSLELRVRKPICRAGTETQTWRLDLWNRGGRKGGMTWELESACIHHHV